MLSIREYMIPDTDCRLLHQCECQIITGTAEVPVHSVVLYPVLVVPVRLVPGYRGE